MLTTTRALAGSALALAVGCGHAGRLELDPRWTAPPKTRFFVVAELAPEVQLTPPVVARILGSVRGGLDELGHSARVGFADRAAAKTEMKRVGCDATCALLVVGVRKVSSGSRVSRMLGSAGDLSVELEIELADANGAPLAKGELEAVPFEDDEKATLVREVVPTIGPAIAQAVSAP